MLKRLGWAILIVVVLALPLIQLAPYGRRHTNPPGRIEPTWDSLTTRELAVRACFDCHSNETVWPWYASIAPASWLIQRDVDEGRRKLNFSQWDRPQREAHESAKSARKGKMPPWFYMALQPQARLTPEETQALARGLETTLGPSITRRSREGKGSEEGAIHSTDGGMPSQ